jgi:hypothetical protein
MITSTFCNAGRRKLHNEELHDFYSSPSIIRHIKSRRMRYAGHVACMKLYKVLLGKPDRKSVLEGPRRGWEDGIRMNLRKMAGKCGVDSVGSGYDRWRTLVNTVMNLRVLGPRN